MKKRILIILAFLAATIGVFSFLYNPQTITAEITEINDRSINIRALEIEGSSQNTIRGTDAFVCPTPEEIRVIKGGEECQIDDLAIGDIVVITYSGHFRIPESIEEVLVNGVPQEIQPTPIVDGVRKIKVLGNAASNTRIS